MIIKWIQSLLSRPPENVEQGRSVFERVKDTAKKDEVVVDDKEKLSGLIGAGLSAIRRKKFKDKVKKRVASLMDEELSDDEIIEEVTEKLVDAAEADPYYKRLLGGDEE